MDMAAGFFGFFLAPLAMARRKEGLPVGVGGSWSHYLDQLIAVDLQAAMEIFAFITAELGQDDRISDVRSSG